MRDFSHGKVRKESIKCPESFILQVNAQMVRMTGANCEERGFSRSDILRYVKYSSSEAAELLLFGTDFGTDLKPGDRYQIRITYPIFVESRASGFLLSWN